MISSHQLILLRQCKCPNLAKKAADIPELVLHSNLSGIKQSAYSDLSGIKQSAHSDLSGIKQLAHSDLSGDETR